jgi:molybdate transport system regulatory protein
MDADVEARLQVGDVTFGTADAELLRAIAEHGSVSGATEALGRSRARGLNRLTDLEDAFGSLVERQRGGAGGGGSRLTAEARRLLARFDRLCATLSGTADVAEAVLSGEVIEREGELGLIDVGVGTVRALLVDEAMAVDDGGSSRRLEAGVPVQVSVRADTVTLHDPADAPRGSATSARNRFPGTVSRVDSGESIAHVSVDVGAGVPLLALVTHDSLDRLGLDAGVDVVAAFKATATRATAAER